MYMIAFRSRGSATEKYIYHSSYIDPSDKALEPKLNFEDNKAGSVEFKIPPTHPYYDSISNEIFKATVFVYRDTEMVWSGSSSHGSKNIWQGRIVSVEKDFIGNKSVRVEGVLTYFNDSYQINGTYTNSTLESFIESVLSVHNASVTDDRKVYKGTIDPSLDPVDPTASTITPRRADRYTDYEKTMDVFSSLINDYGGHMYVTIDNDKTHSTYGKPLLNYRNIKLDQDLSLTNNQVINFGDNLLDYVETQDYSDFASVILPLGDSKDSDDENHRSYVTLDDLPSGATIPTGFSRTGKYLIKTEEYNKFGWVCTDKSWNEVTDPSELLKEAARYLKELQNNLITLKVKAVDLHYLDTSIDAFRFLDVIHVTSVPHKVNKNFLVTKLNIRLDDPTSSEVELGAIVAQPLTNTVAKNTTAYRTNISKGGSIAVMSSADVDNATPLN